MRLRLVGGGAEVMVGIVVAAHGRLAEELVATAEQIVGKLPQVASVSIEPGTPPAAICERVSAAIRSADNGDGVLVLADLFGGTPCNQSLTIAGQRLLVEVLTGVNLPMVLKAASLREQNLPVGEMAATLVQHAQRNITCASALVRDATHVRSTH